MHALKLRILKEYDVSAFFFYLTLFLAAFLENMTVENILGIFLSPRNVPRQLELYLVPIYLL